MKLTKIALALSTTVLLSACGGGGGGSSTPVTTPPNPTTPTTPTVESLFKSETSTLPSAEYLYPDACTGVEAQQLLSAHINDDNYADFIVQFSCPKASEQGIWDFGTYQTGALPNVLVAYLSDGNGGYTIENELVFGETMPSLAGKIHGYDYGDINGDGKTDIALGLSNEDGRRNDGDYVYTNEAANHTVLMSTPTGYRIDNLGVPDWNNFSVQIVDNTVTFSGFLLTSFITGGEFDGHQTFKYENGEWIDIRNEFPYIAAKGFHRVEGGEYILNTDRYMKEIDGNWVDVNAMMLYRKVDGEWSLVDDIIIDRIGTTYQEGWNNAGTGTIRENPLYSVDGVELIDADWYGMQPITVNGETMFVTQFTGLLNVDGFLQDGDNLDDKLAEAGLNQLPAYRTYLFYKIVDGQLERVTIDIENENTNNNANYWEVMDVNGDGYDDIVTYAITQKWRYDLGELEENLWGVPVIYTWDNTNKQFTRLDTTGYPYPEVNESNEISGLLVDVDGNGTLDQVTYSTIPRHGQTWNTPVTTQDFHSIEIFYTTKPLEEIND